jgi:hypothetical protein
MTLVIVRFDVDWDPVDLHHAVVVRGHLQSESEPLVACGGTDIPGFADALMLAGM